LEYFVGLLTALQYECVLDDVEGLITVANVELTDERYGLLPLELFTDAYWSLLIPCCVLLIV